MHLNHPQVPYLFVENLSSLKLVPDAKKFGVLCIKWLEIVMRPLE